MLEIILAALSERWPELVVAFVFGILGTRVSRFRAHHRLRTWIAEELVETQTAMRLRADPIGGWTRDGARAEWMLDPYAMRVNFLVNLAKTEGLSAAQVDAIKAYLEHLRAFFTVWANSKYRSDTFRRAYEQTRSGLDDAVRVLGRRKRHGKAIEDLKLFDRPDSAETASTSLAIDPTSAGPADAGAIRDGVPRHAHSD